MTKTIGLGLILAGVVLFLLGNREPEAIHKVAWMLGAADVVLVAYSMFLATPSH